MQTTFVAILFGTADKRGFLKTQFGEEDATQWLGLPMKKKMQVCFFFTPNLIIAINLVMCCYWHPLVLVIWACSL